MDRIERALRNCLERGFTFVAFRSGDQVKLWISLGPKLQTASIGELNSMEKVFVIEPFLNDENRIFFLRPDLEFDLSEQELNEASIANARGSDPPDRAIPTYWDRTDHMQAVEIARDMIRLGELEKVVLSRTKSLPFDRNWIPQLFTRALKEQPEAFVCLLNSSEFGTWIGASPEMLLKVEGDRMVVDSIAGTLPLDLAPSDPDRWGLKEREEQDLVTRSVIGTFQDLNIPSIQVSDRKVLRAAHVAHLHTQVTAPCAGADLARVAKALHPTPAVCGTPRDRALQFIRSHEPHDRKLYAGFWGPWRWNGTTSLHVNIRCMQLLQSEAILYVGGGITGDSDPAKEWAETEHKALTWQRPLEAMKAE